MMRPRDLALRTEWQARDVTSRAVEGGAAEYLECQSMFWYSVTALRQRRR